MDNNLKTKTINKINDYLAGRISKKEASDWAIAVTKLFFKKEKFD